MSIESIFAALGDPNRTRMVQMLGNKECTVNELKEGLSISQSSTSQHLKVLHEAGLVTFKKHGNFRIYALQAQALQQAMHYFDNLWDTDLLKLKQHLEGNG